MMLGRLDKLNANWNSPVNYTPQLLTEEACMLSKLTRLYRDEEGQDMIEYALLAAFISIVAIVAIKAIGPLVLGIYEDIVDALTPAP